jgi:catechol 2,3-dioxygenase-like lactoylglutathione lyase family enzyme
MTTTVSGYSHVTVVVDDLDVAIAFYRDTLGFQPLPRPDTLGPGAWLQAGTAQLHIVVVDEMGPPSRGLPHLALLVPADRWDDTIAALEARGADFVRPPRSREDFGRLVRAAFIRDPAGNVIELTDVGPLPGRRSGGVDTEA